LEAALLLLLLPLLLPLLLLLLQVDARQGDAYSNLPEVAPKYGKPLAPNTPLLNLDKNRCCCYCCCCRLMCGGWVPAANFQR
jgi:hypothetical protein